MRVRFLFGSAIIAFPVLLGSGCASPADKAAQADSGPAMRALGQPATPPDSPATSSTDEASDDVIGSEIRRLLNTDPVSTAGIIVEVDEGKVTLRGAAPSLAAAWRAEAVAHTVKGVKSVTNQINASTPTVGTGLAPAVAR